MLRIGAEETANELQVRIRIYTLGMGRGQESRLALGQAGNATEKRSSYQRTLDRRISRILGSMVPVAAITPRRSVLMHSELLAIS